MYKPPKKEEPTAPSKMRLPGLSALPAVKQVRNQFEEASMRRGTIVEQQWSTGRPNQTFNLMVQWDKGVDMPVWTLYEDNNGESKMHWSQAFPANDIDMLYDIMAMSASSGDGSSGSSKIPDALKPNSAESTRKPGGLAGSLGGHGGSPSAREGSPMGLGGSAMPAAPTPAIPPPTPAPFPDQRSAGGGNAPFGAPPIPWSSSGQGMPAFGGPQQQQPNYPPAQPAPQPQPAYQQPPYPQPPYPAQPGYQQAPPPQGYQQAAPQHYQQAPPQPPYQAPAQAPYPAYNAPPYPQPGQAPAYPPPQGPGYAPQQGQQSSPWNQGHEPASTSPSIPPELSPGKQMPVDYGFKKNNILLGNMLFEAGFINQPTLDAALKLQEMVRDEKISADQAPEALKRLHQMGGNIDQYLNPAELGRGSSSSPASSKGAGDLQEQKAAIDLLIKSGLLLEADVKSAAQVRVKHGGDMPAILQSASKMDLTTYNAALTCLPLIRDGKMKVEQCIIALNYCNRSRVDFDTALDELGWPNPRLT